MARRVLITGASSGIGKATAVRLVERGLRVFGAGRTQPKCPFPGDWITMDVRDDDSVRQGLTTAMAAMGGIDAVVCNAGFAIVGSVEEISIAAAKAQFETNFFGVLRVVAGVLPHLRTDGAGRIVIVGSLAGRAPIPFQAHYSASKAALDALAQALHNEVRGHGVHVSLIEPGDINTPFNERTDWLALEGTCYGDAIRRCASVVQAGVSKAPGPEIVAAAIERALTDPRPRFRYSVGPESWLVPLAKRFLPEGLGLALIRSHFRL